jgi:hypothetical protein
LKTIKIFNLNLKKKENLALNKLLDRIRRQREDLSVKTTKIVNEETDSIVLTSRSDDHTQKNLLSEQKQESEQIDDKKTSENNLKISVETNKKTNQINEEKKEERSHLDVEVIDGSDDSEITISCSSDDNTEFVLSSDSSKLAADDASIPVVAVEKPITQKSKKLISRIMMSSHNVSSLHEIETRNRVSHQRIIQQEQQNLRIAFDDENCSNSSFLNNQNTATYSVDLSHASRDPMIAGPKELFNKNDKKLEIELKQRRIEYKQLFKI